MVTRGDVSLDVEDNRGPDDWPQISDISNDMLRYSVHLPLDPMVSEIATDLLGDHWKSSCSSYFPILTATEAVAWRRACIRPIRRWCRSGAQYCC